MTPSRHPISRRTALGLLGSALVSPQAAMAGSVETLSGAAFGTGWRVAAPPGRGVDLRAPDIAEVFLQIDRQLSPWRADSAISVFNAAPAGAESTDPALREVTAAALEIARLSDGAFDPTVGPLVARWGFGPIAHGGGPDWRALTMAADRVTKTGADMTLDLCGIAKGWALDGASALLRAAGVGDLLFDLGGEFVALGTHPAGRDWRVAVEAPLPGHASPATLRLPPGSAVATSGTRRQSYSLHGQVYSHIIAPDTRAPASGALRSVTVVANTAMAADGWATALCAAGDVGGPELAEAHHLPALFVFEDGGRLRQRRTGAIAEMIL